MLLMLSLAAASPPKRRHRLTSIADITDITGERFVVELTEAAKIQRARNLLSGVTIAIASAPTAGLPVRLHSTAAN